MNVLASIDQGCAHPSRHQCRLQEKGMKLSIIDMSPKFTLKDLSFSAQQNNLTYGVDDSSGWVGHRRVGGAECGL